MSMKTNKMFLVLIAGLLTLSSCSSFNRRNAFNQYKLKVLEDIMNRRNLTIPDSLFFFFPQSDSVFVIQGNTKTTNIYKFDSINVTRFTPSEYTAEYLYKVLSENKSYK